MCVYGWAIYVCKYKCHMYVTHMCDMGMYMLRICVICVYMCTSVCICVICVYMGIYVCVYVQTCVLVTHACMQCICCVCTDVSLCFIHVISTRVLHTRTSML